MVDKYVAVGGIAWRRIAFEEHRQSACRGI